MLISPQGKILWKHVGAIENLEKIIEQYMEEGSASVK